MKLNLHLLSLVVLGLTFQQPLAFADTTPSTGVNLLNVAPTTAHANLAPSMGVVETLQTIQQLCQLAPAEAKSGLSSALSTQNPLARRKAARNILEKSRQACSADQSALVALISAHLYSPDPIVQSYLIRSLGVMSSNEAQALLRQFFQKASKASQLAAIESLKQDEQIQLSRLRLTLQASPYPEIKTASN